MNIASVASPSALRRAVTAAIAAMIIAAIGRAIGVSGAAAAQAAEFTESIEARIMAYQNTWNTHDAAEVSAFYAHDADIVIGNLPALRSRQSIKEWWRRYFKKQETGRRITIAIDSIKLLADDAAIANVATTTGGQNAQGRELLARKARGTWVMHRENEGWFIAALLAMPTENDQVVLTESVEAAKALKPGLRAFVDAFEDAFNSHDAAALSAFFTDDADIIVRNSPLVFGRPAIDDQWRAYFSEPRPYRAIMIVDEIRMIAPDVALINLTATGAVEDDIGTESPVRYTRAAWVVMRKAGEWRIAALRVLPSEDDRIIRESDR